MLSRLFLPSHSAPAKPISSRFGTCWRTLYTQCTLLETPKRPLLFTRGSPTWISEVSSSGTWPEGSPPRPSESPVSLSAGLGGTQVADRQSHLALIVHLRAEQCCIAAGTTYQPQSLAASNRMSVSRGKPNRAPWEQRATREVAAACPLPLQRGGNHLPMCLCSWVRSPFQALSKYNGSNIDLLFSC